MGEPDLRFDGTGLEVVQVLGSSAGGIGNHVASLTAGLARRGAHVRVVAPGATAARLGLARATDEMVPERISYAALDIPSSVALRADAAAVGSLRAMVVGASVVHAHGYRAAWVAGRAVARDLPFVVTWHNAVLGAGPRAWPLRWVQRRIARRADVVLGASSDLVELAQRLGARDARLAPVAAPPMPPPRRSAAAVRRELAAGDRPLVLAVGRLAPQKRFDVLLDASRQWRSRDPMPLVLVAGEGPLHDELQARISAEALPVRLLGHRDDIPDLLAAADVFVLTSAWEARALAVQEAMRAGVAVVATAVGGVPELVGESALMVPSGDASAVAEAVRRLLDVPADRARFAASGRIRAAEQPDEDDTVLQVLAVYREVLAAR